MVKEKIINELNRLIETKTCLEQLDQNIQNIFFGVSIFDTPYLEGYNYYEELIYNLMIESFGDNYIFNSNDTFELFLEIIYEISTNKHYNSITNGNDIYNFFLNYNNPKEE